MTRDIDWKEYEEISANALGASAFLTDMWERLGRPKDPISTESGRRLMEMIINVWAKELTQEYVEWKQIRDDYKKNELDIKQQVKRKTGRSLASYPVFVYNIMRRMFPDFKPENRANAIKLVGYFPIFQFAERI